VIRRFAAAKAAVRTRVDRARAGSPVTDHVLRARARYERARGDRQAAAVTYFGFLSFFPVLALGFAALGYVIEWFPDARADIRGGIADALPGLVGTGPGQIDIDEIAGAKTQVGLLGLVGLYWAGTAWVGALREALRSMWLIRPDRPGNLLVNKGKDALVLVALGGSLAASVALSGVVTSATDLLTDLLGLADGSGVRWLLKLTAAAVAVVSSAVLFSVMFWRLSGMRIPRRRLLGGALLGGIGFEVLKLFATYLVGHTMRNPVYATFAVAVGLLVWINLVTRVTLYAAAWTATEPYTDAVVGEPQRPDDAAPALPEPTPAPASAGR
jgi:membrane protein